MKTFLAIVASIGCASAFAQAPAEPAAPEAVARPAPDKPQAAAAANAPSRQAKPSNKADRLDLDTTVVTGNRELPKVLYIVPWKKAEIGDLPAQPFNTLLDEVLSPVDRDVFKREVSYFHAVTKNDAAPNASGEKPADASR